jgi:hypothetical protein
LADLIATALLSGDSISARLYDIAVGCCFRNQGNSWTATILRISDSCLGILHARHQIILFNTAKWWMAI